MMDLNVTTINSIISDLNKSINEHIISKDLFFTDCNCNTPEQIGKCFNCRAQDIIDDLSCLKSTLEPLAKNTITSIQFIDVEAFCYTIEKAPNVTNVSIEPVYGETYPISNAKPIGYNIFVTIERVAMDSMGGIEGTESNTFVWKAYDKRQLGIVGIPYLLSSWVVNPNNYELSESNYPDEWTPDHDPECCIIKEPDSDCDCFAIEGGYYHPEDDFVYQEMDHIIEFSCSWEEAQFNSDNRIWELGNTSFEMDEFQSNKEYADSCNEDDGRPAIGEYS